MIKFLIAGVYSVSILSIHFTVRDDKLILYQIVATGIAAVLFSLLRKSIDSDKFNRIFHFILLIPFTAYAYWTEKLFAVYISYCFAVFFDILWLLRGTTSTSDFLRSI